MIVHVCQMVSMVRESQHHVPQQEEELSPVQAFMQVKEYSHKQKERLTELLMA